MGLSTAERNRRKRERKKRAKQEEKKRLAAEQAAAPEEEEDVDIEIEYVPEPLLIEPEEKNDSQQDDNDMAAVFRRFQARASALVSDAEEEDVKKKETETQEDEEEEEQLSKRKLREMSRPTVAELKNRVERSDLVEAHDVTAKDPDFLLFLKAVPSTVPVPRHWGRKRKYLQGKVCEF